MFQGGKRTPVRNYEQDTDQPQCFNKTCINMLSVGVCESVSVHTVTFLAGSEDTGLCIVLKSGTSKGVRVSHTINQFYFFNLFYLFSKVMVSIIQLCDSTDSTLTYPERTGIISQR